MRPLRVRAERHHAEVGHEGPGLVDRREHGLGAFERDVGVHEPCGGGDALSPRGGGKDRVIDAVPDHRDIAVGDRLDLIADPPRAREEVERERVGRVDAAVRLALHVDLVVLGVIQLRTARGREGGDPLGGLPPGRDDRVGLGQVRIADRAQGLEALDGDIQTREVMLVGIGPPAMPRSLERGPQAVADGWADGRARDDQHLMPTPVELVRERGDDTHPAREVQRGENERDAQRKRHQAIRSVSPGRNLTGPQAGSQYPAEPSAAVSGVISKCATSSTASNSVRPSLGLPLPSLSSQQ